MPPTHAHFNGSVNLADSESVMREIVSRVPSGLRRVPDGETGDRSNWISFQMQKFLQWPTLVMADMGDQGAGDYERMPRRSRPTRWGVRRRCRRPGGARSESRCAES